MAGVLVVKRNLAKCKEKKNSSVYIHQQQNLKETKQLRQNLLYSVSYIWAHALTFLITADMKYNNSIVWLNLGILKLIFSDEKHKHTYFQHQLSLN